MKENKIEQTELDEQKTIKEEENGKEPQPKKEKSGSWKFLIYFAVIIVLTGVALFLSLYKDFNGVISALTHANWRYLLLILGLVIISYLIDGLIIFIFVRLYTRKYHYPQGLGISVVGAFYCAVTPGASGGQAMQIYTMKRQGVAVSNAASIMIMSFILYQTALILIGVVGVIFKWNLIMSIGSFNITLWGFVLKIPAIPLTLFGFVLNVAVIAMLVTMSYSHKFHNFIMNFGIGFLAKLHIIRNPDEKREQLRIQVENFKIELKRLFSNIPVTILVFSLYMSVLLIRFSIPYFAGLALNGYGYLLNLDGSLVIGSDPVAPIMSVGQPNVASFFNAIFLSSYHQMVSGLIPIPGAAGVSEYFFSTIFANFFVSQQVTSAAQIIWRFMTFHLVLLISGIVAAFYRIPPKETVKIANRKTFVDYQAETYDVRKASVDTIYETQALSRQEIKERIKQWNEEREAQRKKRASNRKKKQNSTIKNDNTEEEILLDEIDTGDTK